jgi:alpha-L-arabinofuranosidase
MKKLLLAWCAMAAFGAIAVAEPATAEMEKVQTEPLTVKVTVDATATGRHFSPRRLGGTNIALWNDPVHFADPTIRQWFADLHPGYIRLPGGSWSNLIYWNGNGVRDADGKVNVNAVGPDGYPAVDYSGYKPGFPVDTHTLHPSTDYGGNVDVKTMQDWVATIPAAQPLPCLNAGTGRPIDAAEWVRWDNITNHFDARVWEIGNELGGSWEPGDTLPDGSQMTAQIYTRRFNAIADACKQVDPTILTGGCAFCEEMIRDCGKNVNFASIHAYPGSTVSSAQENLAEVTGVIGDAVGNVRKWIRQYQPDREKDIQIAFTEWNLAGGLNASDMFSGLWHARMLAEMAQDGVDFATEWDAFTHVRPVTTGGSLLFTDKDAHRFYRKPGYFALWLWNNFTGDRLVNSAISTPADSEKSFPALYCIASRDDNALYVQLINPDEDRPVKAVLQLDHFDPAAQGERVTLSGRNYFWNPLTHLPQWSLRPTDLPIAAAGTIELNLPPFSVTHLRIPQSRTPALSQWSGTGDVKPSTAKHRLQLVLPDEVFSGDRVEAWVQAVEDTEAQAPFIGDLPAAKLRASGVPAQFDHDTVNLDDAVSHFHFTAAGDGVLTLTADDGVAQASKQMRIKPSVLRPVVLWDFQKKPVTDKSFSSDFTLSSDQSVRANKDVARVDLPPGGVIPSGTKRMLMTVSDFPDDQHLNRSNIRGVVFDMRTLNFKCDDPYAGIDVVMQSPANYWMDLGHVSLADAARWNTFSVPLKDPKYIVPMSSAFNIVFLLTTSKPASGSICLDNIGLIVR